MLAGSNGLLDPALYGGSTTGAIPAWQRAIRDFSNFTDNYAARPVADATAATLGLPGDAYLAALKLLGLPFGLRPEDADPGYGYHVLPTSGDFQRLFAPLFANTPPPSSSSGRITQAALTGAASLPFGGEGPSILSLLREGAGAALPQAVDEVTDDQNVRLAAGLLPLL
jgi:hypothetical protein